MQSMIHAAHRRGHLSRHERQELARAEAFSRRTPTGAAAEVPVKLEEDELELIDRIVRRDRTAVSSACWLSPGSAPASRSAEPCSRRSASRHAGAGRRRDQRRARRADRPAREPR